MRRFKKRLSLLLIVVMLASSLAGLSYAEGGPTGGAVGKAAVEAEARAKELDVADGENSGARVGGSGDESDNEDDGTGPDEVGAKESGDAADEEVGPEEPSDAAADGEDKVKSEEPGDAAADEEDKVESEEPGNAADDGAGPDEVGSEEPSAAVNDGDGSADPNEVEPEEPSDAAGNGDNGIGPEGLEVEELDPAVAEAGESGEMGTAGPEVDLGLETVDSVLLDPVVKDNLNAIVKPMDSVIYNLGRQEITVGYDEGQAQAAPAKYKLFDDGGNYVISLEDNAFFPYEVQFKYEGEARIEWFEAPESIVEVGGHTFSVYSEQNDSSAIQQIGVWADGEYVAARPEAKRFTNAMVTPRTLIPLNVKNVNLDLTPYSLFYSFEWETIINDESKQAVWARLGNEDYVRLSETSEKLSPHSLRETYGQSFIMELIAGSWSQLDDSRTRYIVSVELGDLDVLESVGVYTETNGERVPAKFNSTNSWLYRANYYEYFYLPKTAATQTYYYGISLNASYEGGAQVIEGRYASVEAAKAAASNDPSLDVTSKILGQELTNPGSGYEMAFSPDDYSNQKLFTILIPAWYYVHEPDWEYGHEGMEEPEAPVNMVTLQIRMECEYGTVGVVSLKGDEGNPVTGGMSYEYDESEIESVVLSMDSSYSADSNYYLQMRYDKVGAASTGKVSIDKAVVGNYSSLDAAAGQKDIQGELFSDSTAAKSGYLANYSGNGKIFTIFVGDEVHRIHVKAIGGTLGSAMFEVTSATGLNSVYILPEEHDDYYGMGYQTLFYTDTVSPAGLKPTFETGAGVTVSAGSTDGVQVSGQSKQDFSDWKSVQYVAKAANGKDSKNYWVTFVQQTDKPKLFVNGINGDRGARREVFLIDYYDNKHDIFIANVGKEPLTGLSVELSADANVCLDEYWTVGGSKNNTLAAFTETSQGKDPYGELPNVAKIRLRPLGDGEINAVLTIKADGQEDVKIQIAGFAGDTRLTTETIPAAVKYVPYAVQILNNNQYSWNDVTMKVASGTLPAGISLKPNGELYGVPTQTGTFRFTIQLTNSDSRFEDSSVTYTLVVNDNTNTNVDGASDAGYEVMEPVGTLATIQGFTGSFITGRTDEDFVSKGAFEEFVDVWLNGQKLVRDVDYTAKDGSTRITIKSQTFQNKADKTGVNTIAAEFRVSGDVNKPLKRTVQNFKVVPPTSSGSSSSSGGSSSRSSSARNTSSNVISLVSPGTAIFTVSLTDSMLAAAMAGAGQNGNMVTVKINPAQSETIILTLGRSGMDRLTEKNLSFTLDSGRIGALTFNPAVLGTVAANAENAADSIAITMTAGKWAALAEAQQAIIPEGSALLAYSLSVAGKEIRDFGKSTVAASVPFTLPEGIKATQAVPYYLNETNNTLELAMGEYNETAKRMEMRLRHFSTYVIKVNAKPYNGYGDLYEGNLDWAMQRDLLDPYTVDGQVDTGRQVRRGDYIAALMKGLGIHPPMAFTTAGYNDVSGEQALYVRTAKELGLLDGINAGPNRLGVNSVVARGEQYQLYERLIQAQLLAVTDQNTGKSAADFEDAGTVPARLLPAVTELIRLGVIPADGRKLNVNEPITVSQLCAELRNMATPKTSTQ